MCLVGSVCFLKGTEVESFESVCACVRVCTVAIRFAPYQSLLHIYSRSKL